MDHGVSVVIPALNEAENIAAVVREMPWDLIRECIVVDNGSTDATASEAKAAGARVVSQPQRGYGRACAAGAAAADTGSNILVFMDGDGSDVPTEMGQLLQPILAGDCDFVIGSRMRGQREPGSMLISQIFAGLACGPSSPPALPRLLHRHGTLSSDHAGRPQPSANARRNLRLEPRDADAGSPMQPTHPRNPGNLQETCRRHQQGSRFAKRLNPCRHPHNPNPAPRCHDAKALTEPRVAKRRRLAASGPKTMGEANDRLKYFPATTGCPTSRSFFARCGIQQTFTERPHCLTDQGNRTITLAEPFSLFRQPPQPPPIPQAKAATWQPPYSPPNASPKTFPE